MGVVRQIMQEVSHMPLHQEAIEVGMPNELSDLRHCAKRMGLLTDDEDTLLKHINLDAVNYKPRPEQ